MCSEEFLSEVKAMVTNDVIVEPCVGEAVVIFKTVMLPDANSNMCRKRKVSGGVWTIGTSMGRRYGWTMHDRYGRGERKYTDIRTLAKAVTSVNTRVQQEAERQLRSWEYDDQARVRREERKAALDTALVALNTEGFSFKQIEQRDPTIEMVMGAKTTDVYTRTIIRGDVQDDGNMRFWLYDNWRNTLYMTVEQMKGFVALLKSWGYVVVGAEQ